ncbi:uncharacterized protein N0V89_009799 [Didymosphaeria variabile]|uniref:FAD/NAD(P)-binding domain-containing protein n=1 Tax=Didymosphaeria variabile TaxID=1932322 RepID=A0A9W8XEM1_9PLEO|nr:uncharacterized protein N0V89_009799 [Didymosphaeria variabile]KAJ4348425.1 hypothetical protein N0V89_009799 [Didymosphaeria variabile]
MFRMRVSAISLLVLFFAGFAHAKIDEDGFEPENIIQRDVVIVGGGASGTYAAVRLREDLNTSITNTTLEYGVQSYMHYGPTVSFFERFGIEFGPFTSRRLTTINVDVETGKRLDYTPPAANETTEALRKWLQFVEKYNDLVEPGFWNFPPPDQIPAVFLTPFGEFVQHQKIEAAVPRIVTISGVGVGSLQILPTLQVVQAFGLAVTKGVVEGTFIQPKTSNSLLYQRAYELLKEDVRLNSTIHETERDHSGVRIVVKSGSDTAKTLIKAKRALWTPFPSQYNLKPFGQDEKEFQVFRSWVPEWSYVGVASIPCIPENSSIQYLPREVEPSNHLAIRHYPHSLSLGTTGPSGLDLFRVMLGANYSVTYEEAEEMVTSGVQKLIAAGTLNYTGHCEVDMKALSAHNGVLWPRQDDTLEHGFVQELYSLQGYRSTWWTGRSWCEEYSSNVWAFTDTVLERLLKTLE